MIKDFLKSLCFVIFPLLVLYGLYKGLASFEDSKQWTKQHPLSKQTEQIKKAQPLKQLTFYLNKQNKWIAGPNYSKQALRELRTKGSVFPTAGQALETIKSAPFIALKVCGYSIYEMHSLKKLLEPLAEKTLLFFCRQDAQTMFSEEKWFKEASLARALVFHKLRFAGLGGIIPLDGDFLSNNSASFLTPEDKSVLKKRGHVFFESF